MASSYVQFTKKERSALYPHAPHMCGASTLKGTLCTLTPLCLTSENVWRCKTHAKTKVNTKNSIRQRMGCIRYSVCMTIQAKFVIPDETNPLVSPERCTYCAADLTRPEIHSATDHIFPLIENCKPTPYIAESANNKVPCCKSCNTSKGNKNALEWWDEKSTQNPDRFPPSKRQSIIALMDRVPQHSLAKMKKINHVYHKAMQCQAELNKWLENIDFNESKESIDTSYSRMIRGLIESN